LTQNIFLGAMTISIVIVFSFGALVILEGVTIF